MGLTTWLTVRVVRRRWPSLLALALVVSLGAGATFVAAAASKRTAGAYDHYLRSAAVGDVVVNPSLITDEIDRALRSLPGVRRVTTDSLFVAGTFDPAKPPPPTLGDALQDENSAFTLVRGSTDGRFRDMDRPVVRSGRLPTGDHEVFVNDRLAERLQLRVGDQFPLGFLATYDTLFADPSSPLRASTETATIVGIGSLADGVLPDHLYPREQVILSPDIVRRHDCLPAAPAPDSDPDAAMTGLFPRDCSMAYRYYSLAVDGGAASAPRVLAAVSSIIDDANTRLPFSGPDAPRYFLISTTTAAEQARVERATRPTVVALAVLAVAAALATLLIAGLTVARELRAQQLDRRQWAALGVAPRARAAAVALPLVGTAFVGVVVALLVAWVLSPLGPAGVARAIEPSPARELTPFVLLLAASFVAVAAMGIALMAWSTNRSVGRRAVLPAAGSLVERLVRRSPRADVAEGVRAAYSRGRSAALIALVGGSGVAVLLAAVVFATSLSHLVSSPASYGWPWQAAWMAGSGYSGVDAEQLAAALQAEPSVTDWNALAFSNDISINGRVVFAITEYGETARSITVADGRLPTRAGEVALGAATARALGVDVGDDVTVAGSGAAVDRATVTGLVVLPAVGPLASDRAGPGTGAYFPGASFEPGTMSQSTAFAGLQIRPGSSASAVLDALRDRFLGWQGSDLTVAYRDPVRPPEVDDADEMRAVPIVVSALLATTSAIALSLAVALSVRSRRRVLGMLRALGFTRRELRTSVLVQCAAISAGAIAVGVPLGVAAGRLAWRLFAEELGVVPVPRVPLAWIVGVAVAVVTLAVAAGAVPARAAARARPASVLRTE